MRNYYDAQKIQQIWINCLRVFGFDTEIYSLSIWSPLATQRHKLQEGQELSI